MDSEYDPKRREVIKKLGGFFLAMTALRVAKYWKEIFSAAQQLSDEFPSLEEFKKSVMNGIDGQIVGVYIPPTIAMKIVQQPEENPYFVSSEPNVITQFSIASKFGTIGLLAHSDLAGQEFLNMSMHQRVVVVQGGGKESYYEISSVKQYKVISPNNPSSNYIDIGNPNAGTISETDVFRSVYGDDNRLVFQTCITAEDNQLWGRIFIIATPLQ